MTNTNQSQIVAILRNIQLTPRAAEQPPATTPVNSPEAEDHIAMVLANSGPFKDVVKSVVEQFEVAMNSSNPPSAQLEQINEDLKAGKLSGLRAAIEGEVVNLDSLAEFVNSLEYNASQLYNTLPLSLAAASPATRSAAVDKAIRYLRVPDAMASALGSAPAICKGQAAAQGIAMASLFLGAFIEDFVFNYLKNPGSGRLWEVYIWSQLFGIIIGFMTIRDDMTACKKAHQ